MIATPMHGAAVPRTAGGTDDAPDRYGRQSAFVFLTSSDTLVQGLLLAEGKQAGHELPVRPTVALLPVRFGHPGLDGLGGLPDGRVRICRVTHEQKVTDRLGAPGR